ncbi:hypothetical protein MKX03_022150 [Papaver bracteatum]|nr:hypothetical protein MKX03_022150 [Papaver bracteatum]
MIKCSANNLYGMFTHDAPQLPKHLPEVMGNIEVIGEGEIRVGTGFVWKFVAAGGSEGRSVVTAVDHEHRSITYTVLEGDVMKDFKSFNFHLDITPTSATSEGTSLVKWSIEYEKANEAVADPVGLLKACESMTTRMNLHLLKQA